MSLNISEKMSKNRMKKRKVSLLYLVGTFPVLSETFIQREILEMVRDNRLDIKIVSFRKGDENIPLSPELRSKILYFKPGVLKIFLHNVVEFLRNPVKYLDLARLILFGKHNQLALKAVDLGSLFVGVSLSNEIRNLDVDHIHAHFATWPTTIALVLFRLRGIPFTFTAHAHDIQTRKMLLKEKISLAEAVVTCTKFNKEYLAGLASPQDRDKIFCVYHGMDLKTFDFKEERDNKVPLILAVGRLIPVKGFPYLIDALELVKKRGRTFQAVIIGEGPESQKLKQRISERNLIKNVNLLGALPFEDVKKHFGRADIFVAPSVIESPKRHDVLPNVLIEAMFSGVPVVATRISGLPEAVKNGENGFLVEERDTKALADAIYTLLANQELRRKFGKDGRNKALKMFDIQKNVQRLKQVILGEY